MAVFYRRGLCLFLEERDMLNIRTGITALAFVVASSVAFAQTTAPTKPAPAPTGAMTKTTPSSSSASASVSQTADDVKHWSNKKWNEMKAEWQKDKAKWNSCDTQSKAKGLKGKESWSFFYDCMKA
jgi:hypothetical protein